LRYFVEAGSAVSPEYQVSVVEPINVTADGIRVTVHPPQYARGTFQPGTITGFHDLNALQHSRIRIEVRFSQPAQEAYLVWSVAKKIGQTYGLVKMDLATDHLSASAESPAWADGAYGLRLFGENGFDTELAGGEWIIYIDQPPSVAKFASTVGKGLTG